MIACAGRSSTNPGANPSAAIPVGSDPQLVAVWGCRAQQYLATNNIELNAAALITQPSTAPDIYPPDSRS
jgi:hypothetical protein